MSAPVQRVLAVTAIGAAAREGRTAGGRLVAFAPYARRALVFPGEKLFAAEGGAQFSARPADGECLLMTRIC
jgi:hypothetical protein